MSKPRERHPGTLWFVTRRVHNGEFRLRPGDDVNGAFGYIVALACLIYDIRLVTLCVMSNHYHATLYDPGGRIADWECYVNSRLAAYLNALHGRSSHVFDASEGNAIEVRGTRFIEKSAYTLANPTKARLVYSPEAWPGLLIGLRDLRSGRPRVFRRPARYFDPRGRLPEVVELTAEVPPAWEQESFCDRLEKALEASLSLHRGELKREGGTWAGAETVRRSSPFSTPRRDLPTNVGRGAHLRPRHLGETSEETRAMREREAGFLERYAAALKAWRTGLHDVLFPEGTWRLWRHFGARRGAAGTLGTRWALPTAAPS